jgi:hypothetical protein
VTTGRLLCSISAICVCVGGVYGQQAGSASPQPVPAANSAGSNAVPLSVASGRTIQVALDREVRIRSVGQPIHGRVVQPVYAFDRLVIPVGAEVTGQITKITGPSTKRRALEILNADFTPARQVTVEFNNVMLADGKRIPLHTVVTPGSGQVIQMLGAGENQKNKSAGNAASQKLEEAKQAARRQWHNAISQIETPGKMHRLTRYGVAQLPVHPQYIDAGALYFVELQEPLDFGSETLPANAASTIGTPPPSGSLVHALLVTPLSSATNHKGDAVEAVLSQPLFDGKHLLLPQGSRLRGSVTEVRTARHFKHNGQLRIVFHELLLPDGTPQKVDTNLEGVQASEADHAQLDSEGGAKAKSSKTRFLTTGASVGLALIGSGGQRDVGEAGPVAGGATAFKLVGIVIGVFARSHSLAIVMSAYGGTRSIYSNFLGRGRDIAFPKNTALEIGFGSRSARPIPASLPPVKSGESPAAPTSNPKSIERPQLAGSRCN